MPRRLPLRWLASVLLLGVVACSVPPMDAVRDLAAIHTPDTWRPRTPADMTLPPAFYLGDLSARTQGAGSYAITDHRTLELAILDQIGQVDAGDPGQALESASWVLLELLKDDYSGARVQAAKVLSNLAGMWISRYGARLAEVDASLDLSAGVAALTAATDGRALNAAAATLTRAAIPDAATALRILTALGRRADDLSFATDEANAPIYSLALRLVVIGLEAGRASDDAALAEACAQRLDLLLRYARG